MQTEYLPPVFVTDEQAARLLQNAGLPTTLSQLKRYARAHGRPKLLRWGRHAIFRRADVEAVIEELRGEIEGATHG